jgi:hypothetical protein
LHQSPKNHTRPNVDIAHAGGATVAIPVCNVAKFLISARIFAVFLYRSRNTIERMFGRLKDFRRIAIRYDHFAPNFVAAVCLAAAVSYPRPNAQQINASSGEWGLRELPDHRVHLILVARKERLRPLGTIPI